MRIRETALATIATLALVGTALTGQTTAIAGTPGVTLPAGVTSEPPAVSTEQASEVTQGSATLVATVDTHGHETVYELDLGADTSYGSRIFGDAGSEPGVQKFSVPLQGLKPDTTYHYRLQATNAFGTGYGPDVAFTTASYPSSSLAAPASAPLVPAPLLVVETNVSPAAVNAADVESPARVVRRGRAASRRARRGRRRKPDRVAIAGRDRGGEAEGSRG